MNLHALSVSSISSIGDAEGEADVDVEEDRVADYNKNQRDVESADDALEEDEACGGAGLKQQKGFTASSILTQSQQEQQRDQQSYGCRFTDQHDRSSTGTIRVKSRDDEHSNNALTLSRSGKGSGPNVHTQASPTPVSEVAEITRLRYELNEKNLRLIEECMRPCRALVNPRAVNIKTRTQRRQKVRDIKRFASTTNSIDPFKGSSHARSNMNSSPTSSQCALIDTRTEWPHEAELRQVQKRLRKAHLEKDKLKMRARDLDEAYGEAISRCTSLEASLQRADDTSAGLRRRVQKLKSQHESLASELTTRVAQVEQETMSCRTRLSAAMQRENEYVGKIASQQRELNMQSARMAIMQRRLDDALMTAAANSKAAATADAERRHSAELSAALVRKEGLMKQQARRAAAAVEIQNALIACKRRLGQRESQIMECRATIARQRACNRDMTERCIQVAEESAAADCAREDAEQRVSKLTQEIEVLKADEERLRHEVVLQREEIRQLRTDVAVVSSFGMEESNLLAERSVADRTRMNIRNGLHPGTGDSSPNQQMGDGDLQRLLEIERKEKQDLRAALKDLAAKFALLQAGEVTLSPADTKRDHFQPATEAALPLQLPSLLHSVTQMIDEVNYLTRVLGKATSGDVDFDAEDLFGVESEVGQSGTSTEKDGVVALSATSVTTLCQRVDGARKLVREARQSVNDALARTIGSGCLFQ